MADTFTTNYGITQPEPGTPGWDGKLNGALQDIDDEIAARQIEATAALDIPNNPHAWADNQRIPEKAQSFGASVVWDVATKQNAIVTLTGDMEITAINNAQVGGTYILHVVQDASGAHSLTLPASVKWPDDVPIPFPTTADQDFLIILYCAAAGRFLASLAGPYAP